METRTGWQAGSNEVGSGRPPLSLAHRTVRLLDGVLAVATATAMPMLAKNLAEARPSADGKTTIWYKPSGSWQTARVHWNVYAATGIHLTYGQADMTKTDDGWFKATIDNPHGLRVSLMFARSENSFFWDSGYNGVAQDGNLSVQDHKLVEHAPQQ